MMNCEDWHEMKWREEIQGNRGGQCNDRAEKSSTLHKAIDNKQTDVNKAEGPHDNVVMAVADAPDLTGKELEDVVEVKIDQLSQAHESDESEGN